MKHTMKKRCMIFAAAALMVFPGTTVSARGRGAQRNDCPRKNVCTFADEDKDGICDNRTPQSTQNSGCTFADENKDGICDNCRQTDCRNQPGVLQNHSGQSGSDQTASGSRPRLGCQGRGQGRGRR